jgi:hypothetical protein
VKRFSREASRRLADRTARLALLLAAALIGFYPTAALSQSAAQTGPAAPLCTPAQDGAEAGAASLEPPCAASQPATPSAAPAPETSEPPAGTPIGKIVIVPKGIFDPSEPGENKKIFRLADRLHKTTSPRVIERQLLFESGDPYSRETIQESERILRANRYLYDAHIRPVRYDDGRVDLQVETRDVWTLRLGASLSRAGGENTTNFALEDSNFLGTGKDLTVWRIANVDRTSTLFRYRDPHLYGEHLQLEASYADYSDGGSRRFELERPFYSLDARWAAGFKLWRYDRRDSLYDRGEIYQTFGHDRDFVEVYAGLSPGLKDGGTHRLRFGFTQEKDTFDYAPGGDSTPEPPSSRTLSYPWVGFEYVEDGFVVTRDLDRIQRTEDLNLGRQFQVRLGWTSPQFGGDENQFLATTSLAMGWRPGDGQLLLATADGGTRWGKEGFQNLLVGARLRYYLRDFGGDHLFFAGAEASFARELDPEVQLLIGGDTGLRGYPLRYQQGDRRFLVVLEQRFFSDREIFHLAHLGGAVFFDAGSAWFHDALYDDQQILKDVGVGLRVGSSRSATGSMVHFDLAYPLDGDDSIDKIQWLVHLSDTF